MMRWNSFVTLAVCGIWVRKTLNGALAVGAIFLFLVSSGCVSNGTLSSFSSKNSAGSSPATGLAGIQTRLRRMVPGNVLDDLYYAMQGQPYDRATLAIALKTSQMLADELKLQQHDAGRLSEPSRRRAIAWLESAVDRIGQNTRPEPPALESTNWDSWFAESSDTASEPASVFAFVDRARGNDGPSRFGDFELIISTGQSFYPTISGAGAMAGGGATLQQYAAALDIELVPVASFRAKNLSEMLSRSSGSVAVTDAVEGETWGAMIARRALVRGATIQPTYHAIGIATPAGDRHTLSQRMRAAMWVQAIDGQRLGLVEGWRDAQFGGASAYPSRLADPDWLEAAAHTSMEIRQHSKLLAPFRTPRKMAVLIDASALNPRDPNAWSADFTELADALVDWQIPFDVVENNSGSSSRYEYKLRFKPGSEFSPDAAAKEASKLLTDRAADLRAIIFAESGTDPAERIYVRQTADGSRLAVVNLSDQGRSLKMISSEGKPLSQAYTDRLTGKTHRRRLPIPAYGVCILERK